LPDAGVARIAERYRVGQVVGETGAVTVHTGEPAHQLDPVGLQCPVVQVVPAVPAGCLQVGNQPVGWRA
jgi:hypothetical protein